MWTLTHGHKLRIWAIKHAIHAKSFIDLDDRFQISKVGFDKFLFLGKVNCIFTCSCGQFAERKNHTWISDNQSLRSTSTYWFLLLVRLFSQPVCLYVCMNICRLVALSVSSPAASTFRVWVCSYLCISVLTECKETLTQEPFPRRDRYTVYILLFSVMHILQERF